MKKDNIFITKSKRKPKVAKADIKMFKESLNMFEKIKQKFKENKSIRS